MMKWRTAVAVILALSLLLAACGGSGGEPADTVATEPSAPTQPSSGAPQSEPTAAQPAAGTPQVETAPAEPFDVAAHLSAKTMELWDVYNTHDPEALKAFYSEAYWAEKAEEVESNMEPFKLFGITIAGEETSPPTEVEPGKWEVRHDASFPLGSLKMLFIYEEFDGEWLLTYAEDQ